MDYQTKMLTVRKTFKYRLLPTEDQEQTMEFVLRRCRELYNAALQERRDAWQRCQVSITCARQSTELPAKAHQKVKPQRRDFHHKTALELVRQYDVIYLEDLQVANLVRNAHLAKSISDAGWGEFRTILEGHAALGWQVS